MMGSYLITIFQNPGIIPVRLGKIVDKEANE